MEIFKIAGGYFIERFETFAVLAGLLFTAMEIRQVAKVQRVNSLFAITKQHREILTGLFAYPQLVRVLDPKADTTSAPVSIQESVFVTFFIFHLNASFRAMHAKMFVSPEALTKDIRSFFTLPIPKAVWNDARSFQDREFVLFVDTCLK